MNLPPMPKPEDFGDPCSLSFNSNMYKLALEAWERVCRALIDHLGDNDW